MSQPKDARQVAVVYLSYLPYQLQPLQNFIHSIQQFKAGKNYDLYIVFKDGSIEEIDQAKAWLTQNNVIYQALYFNSGLDINAYLYATAKIEVPYLLFFNSRSCILQSNWLLFYFNAIHNNRQLGAVSATGSWQSYYRSARMVALRALHNKSSISQYISMLKLAVKTMTLYRRWFPPFPNPHLRTNAFIVRRDILVQLKPLPLIRKKIQAYRFESGVHSFTNQIVSMGWQVGIVGKDGIVYLPKEWDKSNVFWMAQQENLLVSDNQTLQYANAEISAKKQMTADAWLF